MSRSPFCSPLEMLGSAGMCDLQPSLAEKGNTTKITFKGIFGVEARSVWSEGCGLVCLRDLQNKKKNRLQGCLITHTGRRA